MMKRIKKWVVGGSTLFLFIILGFIFLIMYGGHRHCIVAAGLGLHAYAAEHYGNFPVDTNGFGNALLLLVKEGYGSIGEITGPGDNGSVLTKALETGAPIPEQDCSRIYIQGLSTSSNPQIAILWDKKSTRGGDHGRKPWHPRLREVCLVDGTMQRVRDQDWSTFVANQVDLLMREGFSREAALHYYYIQ